MFRDQILSKIATAFNDLESQSIKVDKACLLSCTNSRASDIAALAKVFQDAAMENGGKIPLIAEKGKFYIATASSPDQRVCGAGCRVPQIAISRQNGGST